MLLATLRTAATPQATSASALTRSRSTWSMIAMSPGRRRGVRFMVRRSDLTGATSPAGASARARRSRVAVALGASAASLGGMLSELNYLECSQLLGRRVRDTVTGVLAQALG